jgi:hypothetical protein
VKVLRLTDDSFGNRAVLGVGFSQAAAGSPFQLAATAAAWAGLQQCWSPELYVAPLADRFLRLALQIVARYGGWLAAALTHRSSTVAAAAAGVSNGWMDALHMCAFVKKPCEQWRKGDQIATCISFHVELCAVRWQVVRVDFLRVSLVI